MSIFNEFYPLSDTIGKPGMWEIGMLLKITNHLKLAKAGDREAESKLINRLGQLRRNVETFSQLSFDLSEVVKEAVAWIRTTGRTVNFQASNPGSWITARDGITPRF